MRHITTDEQETGAYNYGHFTELKGDQYTLDNRYLGKHCLAFIAAKAPDEEDSERAQGEPREFRTAAL